MGRISLLSLCILPVLALGLGPRCAEAGVISSGTFEVGVFEGNLTPPAGQSNGGGTLGAGPPNYRGFRRVADNFDPIRPGTPRDAWGISANANVGYVDNRVTTVVPNVRGGVFNIVRNGTPSFTATTGFVSTFLVDSGSNNLLQIDHGYSFVADNVLKVAVRVFNVSGVGQDVFYRRLVDFDFDASAAGNEIMQASPLSGDVVNLSFNSGGTAETINPLLPFTNAAQTTTPDDYGAAFTRKVGVLAGVDDPLTPEDERERMFNLYYAVNRVGQTEQDLRDELSALGVGFIISGRNGNANTGGFPAGPLAAALGTELGIPEPATLALLGLGLAGAAAWRRRKR